MNETTEACENQDGGRRGLNGMRTETFPLSTTH